MMLDKFTEKAQAALNEASEAAFPAAIPKSTPGICCRR